MAGSLTNSFETDLAELLFNNTALANIGDASGLQPSGAAGSLYVALTTTLPTDSAAGTEATFGGYARQAVARTSGGWTVSGNNVSNAAAITFPEATSGSETIVGFEIYTASSGGDRLAWADVTTSRAVATGVTVEFAIGELDINFD